MVTLTGHGFLFFKLFHLAADVPYNKLSLYRMSAAIVDGMFPRLRLLLKVQCQKCTSATSICAI